MAADIRLGVEVEFRTFYLQKQRPNFSFQFRESKLFFDTFISDHSSALMEFVLKEDGQSPHLDRGYFIWHGLPLNTRIKFGQIRIPFGFWDTYTIERSLTKNTLVGEDDQFPQFKLRKLDIGVEVQSSFKSIYADVAVLNGNTIDNIQDDNNNKDVVARLGIAGNFYSFNLNTYFGTTQRLQDGVNMDVSGTRHVTSVGGDFVVNQGNLTVSGEVVTTDYTSVRSLGGYFQFNYDLLDLFYGLRFVGKFEYWDPNNARDKDEVFQSVIGFKQSIRRGMTLQIEYKYHTRQAALHHNGVLMELELEL
ncbi:MAG: hypothetical protein ACE5HO_15290 [bacterium]